MITRLRSIEDVAWFRFCEQSIPAMDASQIDWPAGVDTWAKKEDLLATRLIDLMADRKGLAFVIRTQNETELMIGAGLIERRAFRLLLTFYTPEGAQIALAPNFVQEWLDWVATKGVTEIFAPVPAFRAAAIGQLFGLTDDDFEEDASGQIVARLWHQGAPA